MASIQEAEMKEKLSKLPGRNKQCDVLLQVGDDSFPARKDVLMLRMDYFQGMFNANMQEKDKMIIKLDPQIVDPAVFDELLDYVYNLNITFTPANLQFIYRAANFFCFDELKIKAENFMKSIINLENVSLLLDIAIEFGLKAQEEECKQLIISNPLFAEPQVSKTRPEVAYLNFTQLSSLLQQLSDLSKFEDMFHTSVEWILYDEENRSKRAFELLEKIPLDRLTSEFCKQVICKNAIVMNDIECLQLLFKSVIGSSPVEDIYVLGGSDETALSSMSKYDSLTRQWSELSPMPEKLTHFACCVLNQMIYVCGGWNGTKAMDEMFRFDTNTHQWNTLKAMKHIRHGCAMALLDDHLYVAGGYDSLWRVLSVVERYSIQKDEWEDVSPMTRKRGGLELVQLNGILYALGGYRLTVEKYNPLTNTWTLVANMNNSYEYFGSAVLNNRIYVVGMESCEEYNPEEDKWRIMVSPTGSAQGRGLAVFDGRLYALGGTTENGTLKGSKTVQCYDFEKHSWITANDLNIARSHHRVAVVPRK